MHKRFWSLLLAVAMVFSMLPGTALLTNADELPPIHRAAYAASINVDGTQETAWLLNEPVAGEEGAPSGAFGALWNASTLYIAVNPGDATTVEFSVNGKTLTATIGETVTLGGELASADVASAYANILELSIPFSSLDFAVLDYDLTMPLEVTLNNGTTDASYSGPLGFIGITRTRSNMSTSSFGSGKAVLTQSNNGFEDVSGGIHLYDLYKETGNGNGRLYLYQTGLFKDKTVTRWTEFDFHADSMPVETVPTAIDNGFANFGFSFYMSYGTGTCVSVGIVNTADGLRLQAGTKLSSFYSIPIGKNVGDTFHLAVGWTADDSLLVYIDGNHIATLENVAAYAGSGSGDSCLYLTLWRRYSVAASSADDYDITLSNLAIGTGGSGSILDALTAEDILGSNTAAGSIVADLSLPESVTNGQITAPLTWTSSNPDVIANDGTVTRGVNDQAVTMTATVTGTTLTKTIPVTVSKLVLDAQICTTAAITIDGDLKENSWYNTTAFPGSTGTISALWDKDNLYFGVNHGGASSLTLTLGEKEYTVTADSVPEGITASFGSSAVEVQIPFSSLGIRPSDYNVSLTDFQAKLDDTDLAPGGTLDLVLTGDIVKDIGLADKTFTNVSTTLQQHYKNGYYINHDDDMMLSQTLLFTDLPVCDGTITTDGRSKDRYSYYIYDNMDSSGAIDATYQTLMVTIYRSDEAGNLYLRVSNGKKDNSSPAAIPLNKKLGDTFRLDTLWGADNSATVFVDGVQIGHFENITYRWALSGSIGSYIDMCYQGSAANKTATYAISNIALVTTAYESICDEITPTVIFGDTDLTNVTSNLNMPSTFESLYLGTVPLTWVSSDESVISTTGTVTQPAGKSGADIELKLSVGDNELWRQDVFVPAVDQSNFASPTTVNASFNPETIALDGILTGDEWSLSSKLQDSSGNTVGTFGAQWQEDALFLAVDYGTAASLSLSVNGKAVAVDLTAKTLTIDSVSVDNASVAVSGTVAEIKIPFTDLGITVNNYGIQIPVTVSAGSSSFTGNLKITSIDWAATHSSNTFKADVVSGVISDGFIVTEAISNGYRLYDLYNYEGSNLAGKRNYAIYMNSTFRPTLYDRATTTYVEFDFLAKALPVTTASAATGWDATIPCYGFTWVLTDEYAADGSEFSNVVSCGIFNTQDGLMLAVMDINGTNLFPLDQEVGDLFRIGTAWYPNGTAAIYINGELTATVENAQRWLQKIGNGVVAFNTYRDRYNAATCREDNIDVYVTNLATGKFYGNNLLDSLTFDTIKGENTDQYAVTSDLVLSDKVSNNQIAEQTITWESSDTDVVAADGTVNQPAGNGKFVTLTATMADNSKTTIDVYVMGQNPSEAVLIVENDKNPAVGAGVSIDTHSYTLDENNNSIIFNQGNAALVNVVKLTDGDAFSRLNEDVLTLWYSNDNVTYQQIENFKLLCTGENWYLYDFNITAQYIKVHCTHFDGKEADFVGIPANMISAYYEDIFGANGGVYGTPVEQTVSNNTSADKRDDAYEITPSGVTLDKSVRVYLENELLYHYVEDNKLIVRIPEIKAGKSVTLKIYSGNESAMDISNKEYVYEVSYGAREMMINEGGYFITTLKDGTMVGMSNDPDGQIYRSFSYNGGRTWTDPEVIACCTGYFKGHGGFIESTHTDRLIYHGHFGSFNSNDIAASSMVVRFIYSDDGGKTWNQLGELETDAKYALSYSDGLELSCYDGSGDNVDFVLPLGSLYDDSGSMCTRVAYSTDGGNTWKTSDTKIVFHDDDEISGAESGLSESSIMEREDGVLVLIARCQAADSQNFARSYSYDRGVTWTTPAELTDVYTVNTQPMLYRYDDSELLLWSGNNILGGDTYQRTPISVAVSHDGMDTFVNIQDLYVKYSTQGMTRANRVQCTNPALRKWGDDTLVINWTHHGSGKIMTTRVENFTDYFYRTKGAYDSFEHSSTSAKYEGWSVITGFSGITADLHTEGSHAMQLQGQSSTVRSIPYLQSGKISMKIYVADAASANLSVALQSSHSPNYGPGAPLGFQAKNGSVILLGSETASGLTLKNEWNTIVYDLNLPAGKATLSINGSDPVEVPVDTDVGTYVCYVYLMNNAGTSLYVDEFLAQDLDAPCTPADVDKEPANEAAIAMHSLLLEGNIGINYWTKLSMDVRKDPNAYIQFTMPDGTTTKIPVSQAKVKTYNGEIYYAFKCEVAAREMSEQIKAQIFYTGGSSTEDTYCVRDYANSVLNDANAKPELKKLVTAMLNYGAYAQKHFNHNTDDLAAEVNGSDIAGVTAETLTAFAPTDEGTELAKFSAISLLLKANTDLRFFFTLDESVTNFAVTGIDGEPLTVTKRDGMYYVNVVSVAAQDLDEKYTVTIHDSTNEVTVTASALSYCYRVLAADPDDDNLKNLVKALYVYNGAANDYFATRG